MPQPTPTNVQTKPAGEPVELPEPLEKQLEKACSERDTYRRLYMEMLERCRLLELGLLRGRERETGNDQQTSLALIGLMHGESEPSAPPPSDTPPPASERKPRPKPTGRQVLPREAAAHRD